MGRLVAIVKLAGIGLPRRLLDRQGEVHPMRMFDLIMRVNVYGTFNILRFGARTMSANQPDDHGERGVMVNTSSTSAFEGQVGQVAFAAAKGGVAALTLPAARDLAVVGIRVATIVPGLMDTPAAQTMSDEIGRRSPKTSFSLSDWVIPGSTPCWPLTSLPTATSMAPSFGSTRP